MDNFCSCFHISLVLQIIFKFDNNWVLKYNYLFYSLLVYFYNFFIQRRVQPLGIRGICPWLRGGGICPPLKMHLIKFEIVSGLDGKNSGHASVFILELLLTNIWYTILPVKLHWLKQQFHFFLIIVAQEVNPLFIYICILSEKCNIYVCLYFLC